jgi:hypothetical protein
MQKLNKDHYQKVQRIIERIKYNSDKIVRLENRVEKIMDVEMQFQAKVAILNYHKDIEINNETRRNSNREEGTA